MFKYFKLILGFGTYLAWTYPRMLYYSHHVDDIPYAKRFALHKKIIKRLYRVAHITTTVTGKENLPDTNNVVFCPNHQSFVDPTFMALDEKHEVIPVAKAEIMKMPFVGSFAKALGTIFFQRDNLREAYLTSKRIQKTLEDGGNILIYLEGTRSKHPDHHMNEFKPAALKSVMAAKATIVPVFLWGFFNVLDIHCKQKENPVIVEFMKPITPADYEHMTDVELSDFIHTQIEAKVNEQLKK